MSLRARKLLEEALSLPEEERLLIATELQNSLEPVATSEEIDAAWRDELVRRVRSIEDGTAVLHDGAEVLRELKSKYGL